jgi:hypothetical protein
MKNDFDLANLRQADFSVSKQGEPGLGIGDAIVAVKGFESRKSGLFTRFDTPVEVLESLREPVAHVLEDLRMDGLQIGIDFFEFRGSFVQVEFPQGNLFGLVCLDFGFEKVIVERTGDIKSPIQYSFLLWRRIQPKRHHP